MSQLPLPIRQAVFGNVGSLIAFRVGHNDAKILAGEFGNEFPPFNFLDLPRFHALTRLHTNGQSQQPERTRMMGPLKLHCGKPERLKLRSRERFSTSRTEVERRIHKWIS